MALISYSAKDLDLLARLMRAEAEGEGELGMLMVGNVVVNRAIANCLTFTNISTLYDAIYQSPGGFSGVTSPLFYNNATIREKELALRSIEGEYYYPATNALWFYSPTPNTTCVALWYDQKFTGSYKNHCFYEPYPGVCKELH